MAMLPKKIEIVETERVISAVPKGIYDAFMTELDARNKRLEDSGDAAFFVPYGLQLLTEEMVKERVAFEKEKKEKKKEDNAPKVVGGFDHQQSA